MKPHEMSICNECHEMATIQAEKWFPAYCERCRQYSIYPLAMYSITRRQIHGEDGISLPPMSR